MLPLELEIEMPCPMGVMCRRCDIDEHVSVHMNSDGLQTPGIHLENDVTFRTAKVYIDDGIYLSTNKCPSFAKVMCVCFVLASVRPQCHEGECVPQACYHTHLTIT